MTLTETAQRILVHLRRFERDPAINCYAAERNMGTLRPYYQPNAHRAGSRVRVCYVCYQGGATLSRDEAERYLAKLDAGFVGRHHEALREDDT